MLTATSGMAKMGSALKKYSRRPAAVAQASATGMVERELNSKSSSSTARSTADTGLPKMAVIPAAAPAARRIFRSTPVTLKICPRREPSAPPVAMMGPSAPKGPPVPMEIAADKGFSTVTRAGMRLRLAFEP